MLTPSPAQPLLIALALGALLGPTDSRAESFGEASGGVSLVFERAQLPGHGWYEIARPVAASRRAHVEQLLVAEVRKYPTGFLARAGLTAVGVFDGLASPRNDGFHTYDRGLGGYRYFGLYNQRDAVMAAWYSDEQVALTFHHEVFHHIDSIEAGQRSEAAFARDDERFARAVSGKAPYPGLRFSAATLSRLKAAAGAERLQGAVSAYSAKNVGEDQAETARWFMTHLAEGLVQATEHPGMAGSQRILHLLATYDEALPVAARRGAMSDWLARVALGDAPVAAPRQPPALTVDEHLRPGGSFVVRGQEGPDGVNHRLQADLLAVPALAAASPEPRGAARHALELLQGYQRYIEARWTLSASTRGVLERVRAELERVAGRRALPARNTYSRRVDEAISDLGLRAAILAVQPAAVRLTRGTSGGSGVVISGAAGLVGVASDGLVLTAGHVAPRVGQRLVAELPDGSQYTATTLAVDKRLDLSLLRLALSPGQRLVAAPVASAPPVLGERVVTIGQPGKVTPAGEATGYQPFHVSVGHIRKFAPDRLAAQQLGGTGHDAWTYWGHSGAPLFNDQGQIVALHNSWDSTTAMRHAVTWEAIVEFLSRELPGAR